MVTSFRNGQSKRKKDFWLWLKKKCLNCYNLNKGTEPIGEDLPWKNKDGSQAIQGQMLHMKYCPKHKAEIKSLRDWIIKYG